MFLEWSGCHTRWTRYWLRKTAVLGEPLNSQMTSLLHMSPEMKLQVDRLHVASCCQKQSRQPTESSLGLVQEASGLALTQPCTWCPTTLASSRAASTLCSSCCCCVLKGPFAPSRGSTDNGQVLFRTGPSLENPRMQAVMQYPYTHAEIARPQIYNHPGASHDAVRIAALQCLAAMIRMDLFMLLHASLPHTSWVWRAEAHQAALLGSEPGTPAPGTPREHA